MGSVVCAACGTSLGSPGRPAPPRPPVIVPTPPPRPAPPAPAPAPPPVVRKPPAPASLRAFWNEVRQSVTLLVIVASTAIFLVFSFADLAGAMSWRQTLSLFGVSYRGVVERFLVYQIVTAPFLHAGLFHLVFNMLMLYWLGQPVEQRLGRRRYVEMSALCALASMLGFLAAAWGGNSIGYGYSGVIFGILTAMALFHPDSIIRLFLIFPLKMKHAVFVLGGMELYLAITSSAGRGAPSVAHLLGAVAAWWYLRGGGLRRPAWLRHFIK
jgi:membrane associated rhomboid family serine protease